MNNANLEPQEVNSPEPAADVPDAAKASSEEEKRRRLLLLLLLVLLTLCCIVGYFMVRYLIQPQPLPEMVPGLSQAINYPPTYKFSFPADKPVGVALSPDGQRIYVAESGGDRYIKMFDRSGNLIKSFAPGGTTKSTRQPHYIAVDPSGRVFMVDRLHNAIDIFDADGKYLDAIIGTDLTLSKLLLQKFPGGPPAGISFSYDGVNRILSYQELGKAGEQIKAPASSAPWAPLGIRFDAQGNLIYTDITADLHSVHIIPAADLTTLSVFNPKTRDFGTRGSNNYQFDFPQVALTDSKGNFFISDGNNYRISSWTPDLMYRTFFGFGSVEGGLNMPRGMWMDNKDHLHVADAVAGTIHVYDVSGEEPAYLYAFGTPGNAEGEMNYPIDITIDGSGLIYVADSANNRIQVWSY